MSTKLSDLKRKQVINVKSGKNLGKICDLLIDEKTGSIKKIIVSGKKSSFLFNDTTQILYDCIVKIGSDTILVKEPIKIPEVCDNPCPPDCSQSQTNFDEE